MKKMIRKGIASVALCTMLAVTSLAGNAGILVPQAITHAEETVRYQDKTYELHINGNYSYIVVDKQAVIMRYSGSESAISVPGTLDGMTVAAIGYDENKKKGAFEDNTSIQTVTIPGTVKIVGRAAFYNCSGLQQVLVGDGVEEIGRSAFNSCAYMQNIKFQGNSLKVIGDRAFAYCSVLDDVTIPASVEKIGDIAFLGCKGLSAITIPDQVTSFGGGVFCDCSSLTTAVIGNGVTELKAWDYYSQGEPYNSSYQYWGVFENCTKLQSVTIGTGVVYLGIDAFANSGLVSVEIPDNVVTIGQGAFENCDALKQAMIGNNVKTIRDLAFYGCNALESVSIGKKVRTIGERAFMYNTSLKAITIPSSVETLGGAAFYGCTSLTEAVIGNGVTKLNAWDHYSQGEPYNSSYQYWGAFENCTNLSNVTIGNGVINIDTDAFAGTALTDVRIPDNVVTIGQGAFYNCATLKRIFTGNGATSLGNYVFMNCSALRDVTIGSSMISIGERAFVGANALESLLIPSSVTSIGAGLCYGCQSLKKVIIGNGVTELNAWEHYSQGDPYNSSYQYWGVFENCNNLEDVALGNAVVSFGTDTFAATKLSSLVIPSKVTDINQGAFYNSNIKNLYFTGSAPNFEKSLFGSGSVPLMHKFASASGFDNKEYAFVDFTPISVKFDLNDSNVFAIAPTTQYKSPEGGYVIEPISPMAEDYLFLGWYHEASCQNRWDFLNDKVTADTTIYAKWVKTSEAAPQAPAAPTVQTEAARSVELQWKAVSGATGYHIYVDGRQVTSAPITECQYTLTNLDADTAYEVTVTAMNDKGESEKSLVTVVRTIEETVPNPPEVPKLTTKTADTLTIQWEAVLDATGYQVYVNGEAVTQTPVTECSYTITGLEADTEYEINVAAVNEQGTSEKSTTLRAKTASRTEDTIMPGDVDSNQKVDLSDAQIVLKAALKIVALDASVSKAADVNGDGKIDLTDAQLTLKYALKIISSF